MRERYRYAVWLLLMLGGLALVMHWRRERRPGEPWRRTAVPALLADIVREGDIVITQGAGSIGRLAQELNTRFGEGEPS